MDSSIHFKLYSYKFGRLAPTGIPLTDFHTVPVNIGSHTESNSQEILPIPPVRLSSMPYDIMIGKMDFVLSDVINPEYDGALSIDIQLFGKSIRKCCCSSY